MFKMVNFTSCVFYQKFLKIRMGASSTEQAMKGLPESGRQSVKGSERNPKCRISTWVKKYTENKGINMITIILYA